MGSGRLNVVKAAKTPSARQDAQEQLRGRRSETWGAHNALENQTRTEALTMFLKAGGAGQQREIATRWIVIPL